MTLFFRFFSLCSFTVLLLFCSACAYEPQTFSLTKTDSGKTLDVHAGDVILLKLQTNPTTGYGWKLGKLNEKILIPVGKSQLRYLGHDGMCGSPSEETWTFKAVGEGVCGLSLDYVRPWEKDMAPADHFDMLIRAEGKLPPAPEFLPEVKRDEGTETMTDSKGRVIRKPKKLFD